MLRQACPEHSRRAQHERKTIMDFNICSVRPELCRRVNGRFFSTLLKIIFLVGVASCATTSLAPIGKEEVFELQEDERRL